MDSADRDMLSSIVAERPRLMATKSAIDRTRQALDLQKSEQTGT